jgi:hypothetical protein
MGSDYAKTIFIGVIVRKCTISTCQLDIQSEYAHVFASDGTRLNVSEPLAA